MPARDRLQPFIVMTSPEGTEYRPKWIGNERSNQKKLGLFDYPGIAGTFSQDLSVKSIQYPLTVYFDGEDYDLDGDKFFKSCAEVGNWEIEHPVYGALTLQLTSYTQDIQPVTNDGEAKFTLGFFEPALDEVIESEQELKSNVKSQIETSNQNAIESFNDKVKNASVVSQTAIDGAVGRVVDAIELVLSPLASVTSGINSAFNSIISGIDDTLAAAVFEPLQLAGQLINLIQLPSQVVTSTREKLNRYHDLAQEVFNIESDDALAYEVNDLTLGAINSAYAGVASESDARTRNEIIEQMKDISTLFDDIVQNLEAGQSKFADGSIITQYVSMQSTYYNYWLTSTSAIRAMIKSSLGLAIEKRFFLKKNKIPLAVVIEEYGDDSQLDFFNETNNIAQSEFLLLRPGREIVIYQDIA
jgi:prophage DNA circulation protein